jgi:hypothetical protein
MLSLTDNPIRKMKSPPRFPGRFAIAAAGAWVLAAVSPPLHAGVVVTDHIINEASQSQQDVPVTFGQVFKAGDVPRGTRLSALFDGHPVMLQVDAKASNGDGSLRHAVLSLMVPVIRGHATHTLALSASTADTPNSPAAPLSLARLLASGYDASVSLDIGGDHYRANARALLQAAARTGACKPWNRQCNLWLAGPLASEWVVNGPMTDATGKPAANLRVYFAVRAYAGSAPGVVGRVRTDIVIENSDAFAAQGQPRYTATLASGSARFESPPLTQYAYTRWHRVLWWNAAQPQVYVRQDTQYIQSSMAVSRYMQLQPDEKFLASLRQACAPLDHCDQTKTMGNEGAQAAIGPLPLWTSIYIVDPDPRAYRWMLANTDALGAYGIHYRDAATGFPVSIRKHPYVTITDWAFAEGVASGKSSKAAVYKADLLPSCTNNAVVTTCAHPWYSTGNPNSWDNAHQPDEAYVPYMVTGSWYYMSELAFGASHNELWSNETYRGFAQGLLDAAHGQVRGKAWALRELVNAAWLLPDHYPLKAEFKADVENSLADWNRKYTNNPGASPLRVLDSGLAYSVNGGSGNAMAPWQHDFLTWSVGHAAELGFAGAAGFRDWLAGFEVGLMTDWQADPAHGFCWLMASNYTLQVQDAAKHWLPNYAAVYAATFPSLAGLACNSPAMVAAVGKLKGEPWKAGQMPGYPYAPTGFPANFQIGIAAAADSNVPGAHAAWLIFESRSVKPKPPEYGYNNFPNFAVIPRWVTQ